MKCTLKLNAEGEKASERQAGFCIFFCLREVKNKGQREKQRERFLEYLMQNNEASLALPIPSSYIDTSYNYLAAFYTHKVSLVFIFC